MTFRLADSLPRAVTEAYVAERTLLLEQARSAGRRISWPLLTRLRELFSERVERALDSGSGECLLRDDRCAEVVERALTHFDGQRYDLEAWCVMPNHVHAVLSPRDDWRVRDVLHGWKSFTAKRINETLGRAGPVWQREYYDHLIRDDADRWRSVEYVLDNPRLAGLAGWRWVGPRDGQATARRSCER